MQGLPQRKDTVEGTGRPEANGDIRRRTKHVDERRKTIVQHLTTENIADFLAEDPHGAVVMLNLIRFHPDGGRERYQQYLENEFPDAPTCLGFDPVLVMTGAGGLPSWLLVVVAAGRVHTTTTGRVRRWARGTVGHRVGEGWVDARAILD